MRIFSLIIFVLVVSCCTAEEGCEVNSAEENDQKGVCIKINKCELPPTTPAPKTLMFSVDSSEESKPFSVDSSEESKPMLCKSDEICCPKNKILKSPSDFGCGYSIPEKTPKSKTSTKAGNAAYAEFPWIVALMIKKNMPGKTFEDEYTGGGTLIHPSVVMTAAHKVYNTQPKELKCRAGEWNWSIDEKYKHQERDVAEIIVNEEFNLVYIYYNVALLVLSSPFDLADAPHIGVGCLEPILPIPGTICYSMGWGVDIRNNKKNAVILKKIELPLIAKNVCENLLKSTQLGKRYKLHKSTICAGGEADVDTCQGDGGSPLVCRIPDPKRSRYAVVGIVGYGVDCGLANVPGLYSKVPVFYDWVINKMKERNFDTTTFKYNIM